MASDIEQAVAEALRSPDHEQCRQSGPEAEAECLLAALAERGYHVTRSDLAAKVRALTDKGTTDYERGWNRAVEAIAALVEAPE